MLLDGLWYGFQFVAGLVVLGFGGDATIRGAERIAVALGMSRLVVGLTIVAFGTSAPEVAVSVYAAAVGQPELAVGNIVGSNIANLLLILGAAVLMRPLKVSLSLVRTDLPVMVLTAAVFLMMAIDNAQIDRWEGIVFLGLLVAYTISTIVLAQQEAPEVREEYEQAVAAGPFRWFDLGLVVMGIAALVFGAQVIVAGATGVARLLHVGEEIIGLTIVAVGTSLPELAASVAAARRNQPDIAIGNIIGSNIFNVLSVAGIAATIQPLPISRAIQFVDGPAMIAVSLLTAVVCWKGRTIRRLEGAGLLCLYGGYVALAVSRA